MAARARQRQILRQYGVWRDADEQAAQVVASICNLIDRTAMFHVEPGAAPEAARIGVLAAFPGLNERLLAKHQAELERMARLLRRLLGRLADASSAMDVTLDEEWRASACIGSATDRSPQTPTANRFSPSPAAVARPASPPSSAAVAIASDSLKPGHSCSSTPLLCLTDLSQAVATETWRKAMLVEAMDFKGGDRTAEWRRHGAGAWGSGSGTGQDLHDAECLQRLELQCGLAQRAQ